MHTLPSLSSTTTPETDLAPLSWVIGEWRITIANAIADTRTFLDNHNKPEALQEAIRQLHAAAGALHVLDLPGPALVVDTAHQVCQRWANDPTLCLPSPVKTLESALNAVRTFIDTLALGRPIPPLRLFPYYRDLLQLLGAARISPADLLFPPLQLALVDPAKTTRTTLANELITRRHLFEDGLSRLLRDASDPHGASRMRAAVADLDTLAAPHGTPDFWHATHLILDAIVHHGIAVDVDLKRFLARVNQQLQRHIDGGLAVAERLLIDALFHLSRHPGNDDRVQAVKAHFRLDDLIPTDFEHPRLSAGNADALTQLRDLIAQAKPHWSQLASADHPRPDAFLDDLEKSRQCAQQLGMADVVRLTGCIHRHIPIFIQAGPGEREAAGMEIATALLLLESAAQWHPNADPLFPQQVSAMVERIEGACAGSSPLPEPPNWLADLARQAQERSSLISAVTEMRSLLRDIEVRLDRYFRDPSQVGDLPELESSFDQIAGVLSVLGYDDPATALKWARDTVTGFLDNQNHAVGDHERVADIIGTVGFFITEISLGTPGIHSEFILDPDQHRYTANLVGGSRVPRLHDATTDDNPAATPAASQAPVPPPVATTDARADELFEVDFRKRRHAALELAEQLPQSCSAADADRLASLLTTLEADATLVDDVDQRKRLGDALRALERWRHHPDPENARQVLSTLTAADHVTPPLSAPLPVGPDEEDQELHAIFLEEASDILDAIDDHLQALRNNPGNPVHLTLIRRAFHTLKGSSRMVGLDSAGAFSWAVEQCFNIWIANEKPVHPALLTFAQDATQQLRHWLRDGDTSENTLDIAGTEARASAIQAMVVEPFLAIDQHSAPESVAEPALDDSQRQIGPLIISHALYSVYLNESDECIRALCQQVSEWRYEPQQPPGETILRCIHTLTGISHTVGLNPVATLAGALQSVLRHLADRVPDHFLALQPPQFDTLENALEKMRGMLHQFAADQYPQDAPLELGALADLQAELQSSLPDTLIPVSVVATGEPETPGQTSLVDQVAASDPSTSEPLASVQDEIDEQLLEIFSLEVQDLLPPLSQAMARLARQEQVAETLRELMRHLHTLKGSARMAGAMQLGEQAHALEGVLESAATDPHLVNATLDDIQGRFDRLLLDLDDLRQNHAVPFLPDAVGTAPDDQAKDTGITAPEPGAAQTESTAGFMRVRADTVDHLVDHAGEIAIARTRLQNELGGLRTALSDLTENIQRLRSQLREVELQADAQIQAGTDQRDRHAASFDPLEFDRYSRLQELTRLLGESIEDVALVQSSMFKGLQLADDDLTAQTRVIRELQNHLNSIRLVPFSQLAQRLYRVARQTAKETHKRVRLDITGPQTLVDRSLLEQVAGPFEHLLRNAIVHGVEAPSVRVQSGKPETGQIQIQVRREGSEVVVQFSDDGSGLDLAQIHHRAVEIGLVASDRRLDERELIDLIFQPGLSTAPAVTELAGRGIGMDAIRTQVSALGGRIAVASETGRGARFTLYLPMSLAMMQVIIASVGQHRYAIPAAMVQSARRIRARELHLSLQSGTLEWPDAGDITLRPLAQLLGQTYQITPNESQSVALLQIGDDRLAISANELSASQEIVVKNVGPQVSRLSGILGATVLGDGQVVLIVNPVQLVSRAPDPMTLESLDSGGTPRHDALAPLVMIVDDSLTVRRVTQRLLERHGYRTVLAKDGVDALREMQAATPDIMLVDIEMPRMDGFDLTRNVRSNGLTRQIPIIMITSRTAEKHRRVAFDLGVNEYLGKPYREDDLLRLLDRYTAHDSFPVSPFSPNSGKIHSTFSV